MSDDGRDKTVWTCKVDAEHTVRLDDIPAKQLSDLEKSLGTNWLVLVGAPLGSSSATIAMYERCCDLAGVPARDVTAGELINMFELVPDNRPLSYSNGLPDPNPGDQTIAS